MVSKIYNWFQEDFGGSEDAVMDHLKQHASSNLATKIVQVDSISGYEYDWSLNSAER